MATETKDAAYDDLPDLEYKTDEEGDGAADAPKAGEAAEGGTTKLVIDDGDFDSGTVAASAPSEGTEGYTFRESAKKFTCQTDREAKEKFKQWFNRRFEEDQTDAFLLDLLNSEEVRAVFNVVGPSRGPLPLSGKVTGVKHEKLMTRQLSMDFFDRVVDEGIVADTGYISKRYDEEFDGVTVSDDLREMLVNRDSEHEDLFSDEDKQELLFRVFRHLVVGGSMCQFEDNWTPYLEATKTLYKELVTAHRTSTGSIAVSSVVLSVTGIDCDTPLWPKDNDQNWLYVIVDPLKRDVTLFYGAWVSWW